MPKVGYKSFPIKEVDLEEVLNTIKSSAFVTSPYPVIINLELQCRSPYQEKAIDLIEKILGKDNILIFPEEMKEDEVIKLPSPEMLKGRYILKCIRPRYVPNRVHSGNDLILDDYTEPSQSMILHGKENFLKGSLTQRINQDTIEDQKSDDEIIQENSHTEELKIQGKSDIQFQRMLIAEKLIKSICLISGMKLDLNKLRYPWEVASILANKFPKFLHENKKESNWLHYTTKRLISVTPHIKIGDGRVTKYRAMDILSIWKLGIQMVGIFRGIKNDTMIINDMLFNQGGGRSGYMLKHCRFLYNTYLRPIIEPPTLLRRVKIDILSVNQIPNGTERKNYVLEVVLKGIECDSETLKFPFESEGFKYVFKKDNGKTWMIDFTITYPLEAVFMISLISGDSVICKAAFPAMSIRQGYRIVPFCDPMYKQYAYSKIVAKFEVTDESR